MTWFRWSPFGPVSFWTSLHIRSNCLTPPTSETLKLPPCEMQLLSLTPIIKFQTQRSCHERQVLRQTVLPSGLTKQKFDSSNVIPKIKSKLNGCIYLTSLTRVDPIMVSRRLVPAHPTRRSFTASWFYRHTVSCHNTATSENIQESHIDITCTTSAIDK